ncbi:MAG: APC family permease [Terriglobales bacterium]
MSHETTLSTAGGAPRAPEPGARGLLQGLGLLSATTLVMGSMIGSGIFIVSADIARLVGSPGLLLLTWLITGFMTLVAALSYGELAAAMPQAGGQYVYLREALGPLFGFLYGWTSFLVIQTGTIAAVAIAFAKYLGELVPWVAADHWLLHFGHIGSLELGLNTQELVAVTSIAFLTWLNTRGIKTGARVQNVFTLAKLMALIGLIVLGLLVVRNPTAIAVNFHHFWRGQSWSSLHAYAWNGQTLMLSGATVVFLAMVGSLFSSDAWNNITFTAGEVRNVKRTLPLALALGTGIVTALYLLANLAYLAVLPLEGVASATTVMGRGIQHAAEDRVATAVVSVFFGHHGAALMAMAILVSTFGCNNGLILAGARVYYAMAKDGLFFRKVGELNAKYRVPAVALALQGVWASLLCLSGTYNQILDYVMFSVVLFYILTIIGIYILRWKRPEMPRPYRALGYPVLPAVYILMAVFFDVQVLRFRPNYAGPGLGLVLLGVPVYYAWRWKNARVRVVE